jgi:hypothetical protein
MLEKDPYLCSDYKIVSTVVRAFKKLKLLDKIAIEILIKPKSIRMVSLILAFFKVTISLFD